MPLDPPALAALRTSRSRSGLSYRRHERPALGRGARGGRHSPAASSLLAAALTQERDPRVLEAIFTGLARARHGGECGGRAAFHPVRGCQLARRRPRRPARDARGEPPPYCPPARRSRRRCAAAELRARARLARRRSQPAAVRPARAGDREERVRRRPSKCWRRSAGPRPCRRWRAAPSGFAGDPFLAFSIKVATDRIGGP